MKSFNQFLVEARRNPDQNPKENPVKKLSPYRKRGDVFISFINSANAYTDTADETVQIGLNTKSKYNTPNGIYTYPIVYAYEETGDDDKEFNVPFAGDKPWIGVIQRLPKGKHLNLTDDYDGAKFQRDVKDLSHDVLDKMKKRWPNKDARIFPRIISSAIAQAQKDARNKSYAGMLWNVTRMISFVYAEPNWDNVEALAGRNSSFSTFKKCEPSAKVWALLWTRSANKKFFYDSVCDPDNKGIIHPAERTQCVFFTGKARFGWKSFDAIPNKTYNFGPLKQEAAEQGKAKKLITSGKINKLGGNKVTEHMLAKVGVTGDAVKDVLLTNYKGDSGNLLSKHPMKVKLPPVIQRDILIDTFKNEKYLVDVDQKEILAAIAYANVRKKPKVIRQELHKTGLKIENETMEQIVSKKPDMIKAIIDFKPDAKVYIKAFLKDARYMNVFNDKADDNPFFKDISHEIPEELQENWSRIIEKSFRNKEVLISIKTDVANWSYDYMKDERIDSKYHDEIEKVIMDWHPYAHILMILKRNSSQENDEKNLAYCLERLYGEATPDVGNPSPYSQTYPIKASYQRIHFEIGEKVVKALEKDEVIEKGPHREKIKKMILKYIGSLDWEGQNYTHTWKKTLKEG